MGRLIDGIIARLGNPTSYSDPEYTFQCPFCEERGHGSDRKGKLYVNEDSAYFCFRCEARGGTIWLGKLLGMTDDEIQGAPPEVEELWRRILLDPVQKRADKVVQTLEMPEVYDVGAVSDVRNYATDRGLSEFYWGHYGLKAYMDWRGDWRLLFPDYSDTGLVYWTARAVADTVEPKYDAPKESSKSICVWNLNRVDSSRPIYVAEGIFSARACGANAVASYGKYISDAQIWMIGRKAGPSGVRVVFDGDAREETLTAVQRFLKEGVPCGPVMIPAGEDPDSLHASILAPLLLGSEAMTPGEGDGESLIRHRLDFGATGAIKPRKVSREEGRLFR